MGTADEFHLIRLMKISASSIVIQMGNGMSEEVFLEEIAQEWEVWAFIGMGGTSSEGVGGSGVA